MDVETTKETFLKLAGFCGQALSLKPSLPVLSNFLLTAYKGYLEINATDLDTTIAGKLAVKTIKEGELTVPARTLLNFCQAADGDTVKITQEKEGANVISGRAKARLSTLSPAEFPPTDKFEEGEGLELSRGPFIEAVQQVFACASPDEGRPILTGILIRSDGKGLDFVATDGYRLGKKTIKTNKKFDAVIPARAAVDAAKAFADQDDDEVSMSINKDKTQVRLKTRLLSITTRLIDGDYPKYEQIIPTSFPTNIQTTGKELTEAVRLAAVFAKDIGSVVTLEAADNRLVISAKTTQIGEAQSTIEAKTKGEKLKIAFNSKFLLDSIAAISGEKIEVNFSGPTSAALLTAVGDQSLTHVVMPVRAQS